MKNIKLLIFLFLIGIFSNFAQEKKYTTYKVTAGETIQSIAKKIAVTPYDILKLNPDIQDNVKENDMIIIPNKVAGSSSELTEDQKPYIGEKDILVDDFLYHEILKKETYYSLHKNYNITKEELKKHNIFLNYDGLKQGQTIRIPYDSGESDLSENDSDTQPYIVKPKETKYSISRNFEISIEDLEALNPKIKETGLQIDDIIFVPKKIEMAENSDADFMIHKIEKMETLYSLSNKFNVSQEELILENPQLEEAVREGMLIKIPKSVLVENTNVFEDKISMDQKLELAMMLPFLSKRDSLDFENDRLLNITTDFYSGALIAIDSLKNQGLSVHLKVYDTEKSEKVSKSLSAKDEFENYDVVIGPMYLNNVKVVSRNLQYKKPLVVSPISSKDHSNIGINSLVQEVPAKRQLTLEMIEFIKSNYTNQKLILITDDDAESQSNYNLVNSRLQSLNPAKEITVIKPVKGYIKPDVFRKHIEEEIENWVLLVCKNKVIVADVINNLGVIPVENNITLFAFDKGSSYAKADNNFLARVNFHYPSSTYIDEGSVEFKYFVNRYFKDYHTYPSKYAIDGFDITYDILMRLSTDPDLINQGVSKRFASRFDYVLDKNTIINRGVFIIKYDGLNLKVVD